MTCGQNVSYGDGLYVTNTTSGAPRVGFVFWSHPDVAYELTIYPVCRLGIPVECHVHRINRCERNPSHSEYVSLRVFSL